METISTKIFHLAECPLWNIKEQALYWTDILNGEIWRYVCGSGSLELFWKGNMQIGGFAFGQNNDLILCSDKGVFLLPKSKKTDETPILLFEICFDKGERFNDITTDPRGRILAGTKRDDFKNGKLYLFAKGKQPEIVLEGIGISNGMTFSIRQDYFYHTDSLIYTITRYKYDVETAKISDPVAFFKGEPAMGYPDGITLDTEGYLWGAFWGNACIRRISPEGKIVEEIKVPAIQPSSLVFGDKNLDTLFITSACEGGADIQKGLDKEGTFLGGHVYKTKLKVKGRPEWLADI